MTARRRNELLQDVPIAVTAYSSEQLDRQGALDMSDIADTTPNVNLETSRGTNTTLTAFIRGVGQQDPVAGFEQGVGIYLDDVYLNRPQGALLDIYDVERIEVLRGPQGTLYGRNTIGGAVKYVTRRLADVPDGQRSGKCRNGRSARRHHVGIDAAWRRRSRSAPLSRASAAAASARTSRPTTTITTRTSGQLAERWSSSRPTMSSCASPGDYTWDNSKPRGGHRLISACSSAASSARRRVR